MKPTNLARPVPSVSLSLRFAISTALAASRPSSLVSSMAPPRILLCGDVRGRLNQLFKRVSTVNKSAGPFDALLCVGQFFPDVPELLEEFTDHVEGRSPVPLPTYFIGDYGIGAPKVLSAASRSHANLGFKMDGLKICENLYWLKGSGKFTLHGLSVGYISGRHSLDGQQLGTYSQDDVDAMRALAEEPGVVDLFLSNEWPSNITNRALQTDVPPGISEASGSDSTIAEIVAEIKPRYHVAGTKGVFYAREPYSNADAVHVTRFIGLAPVGNKEKQKFIHALSPTPAATMSSSEISMKPPNTTLSPFTAVEQTSGAKEAGKRTADDTDEAQYWRYDVSQKRQKHAVGDGDKLCFKYLSSGSCPRGEKCNFRHDIDAREQYRRGVCFDFLNKGKCERGPDCNFKHSLQEEEETGSQNGKRSRGTNRSRECWFCLSSPNVESHLIISVGERYYCALPKGPLVEDHVLIIPIEHSPSTLSSPPESETELNRFQDCLKMYHKNQQNEVVFFEWVSKRGTHANLQAIPVPSSRAAALRSIFSLAAEKLGFKFNSSSTDGRKMVRANYDSKDSLFYVELPEGTVLSHTVEDNENFPAQFGREVVAGLLNVADKADWRNCALSKEEEIKLAEDFKRRFAEFDPNT